MIWINQRGKEREQRADLLKLKRLNLKEEQPRQELVMVLTFLFLSCDVRTPT